MADEIKHSDDVGPNDKSSQNTEFSASDNAVIFIQNSDQVYQPCILDDTIWETQRQGSPGKLTFKVMKNGVLNFAEGNIVKMVHKGKDVFMGYVFTKKRNKDDTIEVIAYDQLRYLKNKDIYYYTSLKAGDLVKRIAKDYRLQVGDIEDTEYVIPKYRGSNETLFDIIQSALDHTLIYSKKMFVLYDDFGKLTLKNIEAMTVDILIDSETAENYSYQSSIEKSYNRIKLYHDNKKTGKREVYISQDSANIARWGILQMCESVNPKKCQNPGAKADTLLKQNNLVQRTLSITNVLGDDRIRAGSSLYVKLNLGDVELGQDGDLALMLVESVKHKYSNNQHTMDLNLRGGIFK